jgi:hypothetical protein
MPQPRQNLCKTEIKIKTVIERNQAKKDHTTVEILNKPERLHAGRIRWQRRASKHVEMMIWRRKSASRHAKKMIDIM